MTSSHDPKALRSGMRALAEQIKVETDLHDQLQWMHTNYYFVAHVETLNAALHDTTQRINSLRRKLKWLVLDAYSAPTLFDPDTDGTQAPEATPEATPDPPDWKLFPNDFKPDAPIGVEATKLEPNYCPHCETPMINVVNGPYWFCLNCKYEEKK